jgi:hypothetical protein
MAQPMLDQMFVALTILLLVIVVDVLAVRFGFDSRRQWLTRDGYRRDL